MVLIGVGEFALILVELVSCLGATSDRSSFYGFVDDDLARKGIRK